MITIRPVWVILGVLLLTAATAAACGPAASPTPEPTSTRPMRPTFTPTVVPTDTLTPEPPTPTPEPTATATEPPTATSEPPSPTPESKPVAVVSGTAQVNTRSGPGTAYPVVRQVTRGTELEIIGRNQAGDWWQICLERSGPGEACSSSQAAWIVGRLVTVQGPTDSVAVAADIPAPPTPRPQPTSPPAPPTNTPAPTPTPAPAFNFVKMEGPWPRPNSNPVITFFGLLLNQAQSDVVSDHRLVVEGPLGRQEVDFFPYEQRGDPGLPGEFIYNAKVEYLGTAEGNYRAWVADSGGNQVAEAYDFNVAGETRTFFPRWHQR